MCRERVRISIDSSPSIEFMSLKRTVNTYNGGHNGCYISRLFVFPMYARQQPLWWQLYHIILREVHTIHIFHLTSKNNILLFSFCPNLVITVLKG